MNWSLWDRIRRIVRGADVATLVGDQHAPQTGISGISGFTGISGITGISRITGTWGIRRADQVEAQPGHIHNIVERLRDVFPRYYFLYGNVTHAGSNTYQSVTVTADNVIITFRRNLANEIDDLCFNTIVRMIMTEVDRLGGLPPRVGSQPYYIDFGVVNEGGPLGVTFMHGATLLDGATRLQSVVGSGVSSSYVREPSFGDPPGFGGNNTERISIESLVALAQGSLSQTERQVLAQHLARLVGSSATTPVPVPAPTQARAGEFGGRRLELDE